MSHMYESTGNGSTAEFTPVAVNNAFHLFSTVKDSYSKCKSEKKRAFWYGLGLYAFIWFLINSG